MKRRRRVTEKPIVERLRMTFGFLARSLVGCGHFSSIFVDSFTSLVHRLTLNVEGEKWMPRMRLEHDLPRY
jgi:hypothetical protein